MKYTPNELEYYLRKSEDIAKSEYVFLDLLERAKQKDLSYTEARYFCTILKHTYVNYGIPQEFDVCREHIFNDLYRIFYKDFHGITELKDKWGNILSIGQKRDGLKQLEAYYEEWQQFLESKNTDDFTKQVAKETKNEIKSLSRNPLFYLSGIFYKSNLFKSKNKATFLRSRYLRNMMFEHIDRYGEEITIHFDNRSIEFNLYSLVHIYFRHYAQIIKQTELEKSFHNDDIHYSHIGVQLKDILEKIDVLKIKLDNERSIVFKYKRRFYCIWISPEKFKSVKGVSEVKKYFRIDTFYPIENQQELEKCYKMDEIKIDEELYLLK
jgi:hypothetical protein